MKEFKAGDLVYCPTVGLEIYKVRGVVDDNKSCKIISGDSVTNYFNFDGRYYGDELLPRFFYATPENHALLEQLYGVEFEKPKPKPTSREIIEHLLTKQKYVACYVSDTKSNPSTHNTTVLIDSIERIGENATWRYATPFDIVTGEIITEIDDE